MSKCSLQLYVNENFTSRPSIESSDDLLKNLNGDCKKQTTCNYRDVLTQPLQDISNSVDSQKKHPILRNYLLRHSGSVKAYHKIIKQQEEILNLCREKLAKRFSKNFLNRVKDEDIVRALKIIQDSEEPTSDKIILKILRGIVSDASYTSEQNEETLNQTLKSLSSSSSRRKYSFVFNKLKTLFKKSSSISSRYKKETDRFVGLFNPIETHFLYNYKPPFYGNFPPPGMGSNPTCACHKNLVKLQNEFEKQQSEIRLINQNLQQCLCLLHDIGDNKPQEIKNAPFDNFFGTNFQTYQVDTTGHLYGHHEHGHHVHGHHEHGHHEYGHAHSSQSRIHPKKQEPKKKGCCKKRGKSCCGRKRKKEKKPEEKKKPSSTHTVAINTTPLQTSTVAAQTDKEKIVTTDPIVLTAETQSSKNPKDLETTQQTSPSNPSTPKKHPNVDADFLSHHSSNSPKNEKGIAVEIYCADEGHASRVCYCKKNERMKKEYEAYTAQIKEKRRKVKGKVKRKFSVTKTQKESSNSSINTSSGKSQKSDSAKKHKKIGTRSKRKKGKGGNKENSSESTPKKKRNCLIRLCKFFFCSSCSRG